MSKAEELANKIAPPPDAEGWYYAPSISELMEAAAHLRALEANRQMLVEALNLMVRTHDEPAETLLQEAKEQQWLAKARAALQQAKELT